MMKLFPRPKRSDRARSRLPRSIREKRNRLLRAEPLEDRLLLAADIMAAEESHLVEISLAVTDDSGDPVSAVEVGESFHLKAYVEDLRILASGVFAAWFDVTYAPLASVAGTITYGAVYPHGQSGETSTPGIIDELGAFDGFSVLGPGKFLLASVPFTATGSGTVSFVADPADLGGHDVLLYGVNVPISPSQVSYGAVDLVISGESTSPLEAVDDSYGVLEDDIVTGNVTDNDSLPDVADLNAVLVTGPVNGNLSFGGDGSFDYTPAADFYGTDSFTYEVSDGNGGTDTATVDIIVNPVNDPPAFTAGGDQEVDEDAGSQTVANWATNISPGPANESGQTVSFNVSNDNNGLFSSQPAIALDGTLTYTSAPNAHGTATVTVTAQDNGGTANGGVDTGAPQTFVITVNSVIDAVIDVKPGSDVNPVNLGARGVLPVAVLSTQRANGELEDFDATTIDTSTIVLNGVATNPVHAAFEDVDGDGDLDLMLHFRMPDLVDEGVLDENSTDLFFAAEYAGGDALGNDVGGSDSISLVPPKGKGNSGK